MSSNSLSLHKICWYRERSGAMGSCSLDVICNNCMQLTYVLIYLFSYQSIQWYFYLQAINTSQNYRWCMSSFHGFGQKLDEVTWIWSSKSQISLMSFGQKSGELPLFWHKVRGAKWIFFYAIQNLCSLSKMGCYHRSSHKANIVFLSQSQKIS
jgi:hypothetical protein